MSTYRYFDPEYDDFLMHYGVKGQVHGIRNYQFRDGTWTELGKERRRIGNAKIHGNNISDDEQKRPLRRVFSVPIYEEDIAPMLSFMDTMHGINDPDPSNPNDTRDSEGRLRNCVYCALAYELRKRGKDDIKAPAAIKGVNNKTLLGLFGKSNFDQFKFNHGRGYSHEAFRAFIKDRGRGFMSDMVRFLKDKPFSQKEIHRMEKELVAEANGSRGIITYQYTKKNGQPEGHAINYEVTNNKVYTIDSQEGIALPGLIIPKSTWYLVHIRTNDAIIDTDAIERFIDNVR